jgi:hypothetical protein
MRPPWQRDRTPRRSCRHVPRCPRRATAGSCLARQKMNSFSGAVGAIQAVRSERSRPMASPASRVAPRRATRAARRTVVHVQPALDDDGAGLRSPAALSASMVRARDRGGPKSTRRHAVAAATFAVSRHLGFSGWRIREAPKSWCMRRCAPREPRGHMDQPTAPPLMTERRPMVSPEFALLETRERRCPNCESQHIVHAGHVVGGGGMLKTEQRCEVCHARCSGSCGHGLPSRPSRRPARADGSGQPHGPRANRRGAADRGCAGRRRAATTFVQLTLGRAGATMPHGPGGHRGQRRDPQGRVVNDPASHGS